MTERRGHEHRPRLRLSIVAVVAMALFASLFARLYDLQVVGADRYRVQAEANRVRVVQLPAPRGRILDRNGTVMVDNRVAVVVAVDRSQLADLPAPRQDDVLARLAEELTGAGHPTNVEQIRTRLEDVRFSRYAPVPIAVDVPEELKIYLDERAADFPAVVATRTAVRAYPFGPLAAHVLGYVGKINADELAEREGEVGKPYVLNDEIGKSGVEQTYERWLRGTPGERRIEVDARGDPVRVISERPPRAGDDLVLTIDARVQALAEQKVQQGLADARARVNRDGSRNAATKGAGVVLDPNNGQVIAMASYPVHDPTAFVDGIDAGEWAYLNDPANNSPLNNWAIQGEWAPGSSYKLFVGYSALMAGVMAPDTVFVDRGGYLIPGSNAGGAAYGNVTIQRAITISSDAYFYNVGAQFWLQREGLGGEAVLQDHLRTWGLGEPTGIALTSEKVGRVPTPEWKREFYTSDPVWRTGDNVNMAIGQGDVLVTPLQLANGYATFANGGTRYVPQVALDEYPVAGKTGTAQVDNRGDTAVFAAFGPAPAPEYAVAVILEESGFGGTASAPVVRALFEGLAGIAPLQPPGPNGLPVGAASPLSQPGATYD
jgi:penicillin-binding protein 2